MDGEWIFACKQFIDVLYGCHFPDLFPFQQCGSKRFPFAFNRHWRYALWHSVCACVTVYMFVSVICIHTFIFIFFFSYPFKKANGNVHIVWYYLNFELNRNQIEFLLFFSFFIYSFILLSFTIDNWQCEENEIENVGEKNWVVASNWFIYKYRYLRGQFHALQNVNDCYIKHSSLRNVLEWRLTVEYSPCDRKESPVTYDVCVACCDLRLLFVPIVSDTFACDTLNRLKQIFNCIINDFLMGLADEWNVR